MATITTAAAVLAALLLLPLLILLWASETPPQRARRWRRAGRAPKEIGARLGVSYQQVGAWCRA